MKLIYNSFNYLVNFIIYVFYLLFFSLNRIPLLLLWLSQTIADIQAAKRNVYMHMYTQIYMCIDVCVCVYTNVVHMYVHQVQGVVLRGLAVWQSWANSKLFLCSISGPPSRAYVQPKQYWYWCSVVPKGIACIPTYIHTIWIDLALQQQQQTYLSQPYSHSLVTPDIFSAALLAGSYFVSRVT